MRAFFILFTFANTLCLAAEVRVDRVNLTGNTGVPASELHRQLVYLRSRTIVPLTGWKSPAPFHEQALQADIDRLQSFLYSRGYLDAVISPPKVRTVGDLATVDFHIESGPRYPDVRLEGSGDNTRGWAADACACLLAQRREAEGRGVLDFQAKATIRNGESPGDASVRTDASLGPQYKVGRIEFAGHRDLTDEVLRSHLRLEEGRPFDSGLLRHSLARLADSGYLEPFDEQSVQLRLDPQNGLADALIRVKEKKRGRWELSGPMGPMSFAGPLQVSLSGRLPGWGRGLLNLSTFSVSIGLIATAGLPAWGIKSALLPVLSLERPYTPAEGWRSGWQISPALGWRYMLQSYVSTQGSQRLMPHVTGNVSLDPPLRVEIEREGAAGGALICEPRQPRLAAIRRRLPMIIQLASAVVSF